MQHHAADELNRIGAHAQHPVSSLPDDGKGLGQQVVQRLPGGQPVFEFLGLALQSLLGKGFVFVLQRQNLINCGLDAFDFPVGTTSEQFGEKSHETISFETQMAIPNQFYLLYHNCRENKRRNCE